MGNGLPRYARSDEEALLMMISFCHCEEHSDVAIHKPEYDIIESVSLFAF